RSRLPRGASGPGSRPSSPPLVSSPKSPAGVGADRRRKGNRAMRRPLELALVTLFACAPLVAVEAGASTIIRGPGTEITASSRPPPESLVKPPASGGSAPPVTGIDFAARAGRAYALFEGIGGASRRFDASGKEGSERIHFDVEWECPARHC